MVAHGGMASFYGLSPPSPFQGGGTPATKFFGKVTRGGEA